MLDGGWYIRTTKKKTSNEFLNKAKVGMLPHCLRWMSVRSLPLLRRQTHGWYWRLARQNQLWRQMDQSLSSKLIRQWSVKTKEDVLHNMKHFLSRKYRPTVEVLMVAYVINEAILCTGVLYYVISIKYHITPQINARSGTYTKSNSLIHVRILKHYSF